MIHIILYTPKSEWCNEIPNMGAKSFPSELKEKAVKM